MNWGATVVIHDSNNNEPGDRSIYAYAYGRIKALETKLLDKSRIERMVSAGSAIEVIRILNETDYSLFIDDVEVAVDKFDVMLNKALKTMYEDIRRFSPEPELTDLFRVEHDFHNLKVVLKAKFGDLAIADAKHALVDLGLVDLDTYLELMKINILDLPKKILRYQKELDIVITTLNVTKDTRAIDTSLDVQMYELMLRVASESGYEFLIALVKRYAALANIKIILRAKMLGRKKEHLDFVSGDLGKLDKRKLLELYDRSIDAIIDELTKTEYGDIVTKGFEYYRERRSWLLFDKLVDNYILNYVKVESKYAELGIEPIIGYIIAKKHEIKLIRLIIYSKMTAMPVEKLRELLRDLYT
jgi:V/A-type H+-transporting ATPase subunit C